MLVYDAIHEMREITNRGETFSFSFVTYSKLGTGGETKHVESASIRSSKDDMMLEYWDYNASENRHCYKHLITEFNGEKTGYE